MYQDILIPNLGAIAVEKAFQETLEKNEELFKNNREQLVDFYFSQQTDQDEYLRDYFNIEIDPNKDPDYPHNLILAQVNITSKLIDKKAKTYKQQPVRLIDGKASKVYDELLTGAQIKSNSKLADRLTWLLGDHCILLIADEYLKKLRLVQPPYYRPVFKQGNSTDPIGVAYPSGMMKNTRGELVESWTYWDEKEKITFEHETWNRIKSEPNPHGTFNALFTHRMKPFRGHWTKDAQDLVDTNRDINVALTSINNAIRYHGFPLWVATGVDEKEASKVKIRFDKLICVAAPPSGEKQAIGLEAIYPQVNWAELMGTIKTRIEMLASTWNVDIRWDIGGDLASGVALKILSIDNRDDLDDMIELYEEYFEVPLFEKIQIISGKISWMTGLAGKKLTLDWPEEEFIESPTERNARLKGEVELNLTNPIDELKRTNPDLSDEDAARQFLRNRNINRLAQKTGLSVDDILAALEADEEELGGVLEKPEEKEPGLEPQPA